MIPQGDDLPIQNGFELEAWDITYGVRFRVYTQCGAGFVYIGDADDIEDLPFAGCLDGVWEQAFLILMSHSGTLGLSLFGWRIVWSATQEEHLGFWGTI